MVRLFVVNKRTHTPTPDDFYIGRPSPLGNPFTHRDVGETLAPHWVPTREAAIAQYEQYLLDKIEKRDPLILRELALITEQSVLVCWCKPKACHGDVIAQAVPWLNTQDWFIKYKEKMTE